jgi:hypothetical protein
MLWAGLAFSGIGDQIYGVVITWIAVGVFGTAAGYLTALQSAIVLATALGCGRLADALDHRTAMVGADLVRAGALLLLVATWAATGAPPAWALVLAVAVLAGGLAFFRPALQASLPDLVASPAMLPAANALLDTTDRIARLLGPGLLAVLLPILPRMHFLTFDALTFLASALAVVLATRGLPKLRGGTAGRSVLASVARGFRALWAVPILRMQLLTGGPLNGAWYMSLFLGVPLLIAAQDVAAPGAGGLGAYGLVISSYGATNLVATLFVGNRPVPARPGTLMFGGNVVLGIGLLLLGIAAAAPIPHGARLPVYCACAAIGAPGGPMGDIATATLRQTLLPRADLAAAMRAYLVVLYGGMLLAMLAAPAVFAAAGPSAVIQGAGLFYVAIGIVGIALHARTRPVPAAAVGE